MVPMDGGSGHVSSRIQIYVDGKDRISVDRVSVTLKGVTSRVERFLADKPSANTVLMAERKAMPNPVVCIKDHMNVASRHTVVKAIRH